MKGRKSMEEMKQKEPVYSGERTNTTGSDSLRSTTAATEFSGTEKTVSKQAQTAQKAVAPETSQTGAAGTTVEFAEFLKPTKRVWLIVAVAIFGMMAVVTVATRMSDWTTNTRHNRH